TMVLAARVELVLDHPQWQVPVPLGGEDVAQPLHVSHREFPVAGRRPGRLDQPFGLQETDLPDAHLRKNRAQLGQPLADPEVGPGGLSTHAPTCAPPPWSAWERRPARNISRNLPT